MEAPGRGTASTTAGMAEPMTGSMVIGKEVVTVLGANLPGAGEKYKLVLYKINTNIV